MFNTPETFDYNQFYNEKNNRNIVKVKKIRFNWLLNRNQYSLYELWSNWLLLIVPLVLVLMLAIWLPIQNNNLTAIQTGWFIRYRAMVDTIDRNSGVSILQIDKMLMAVGIESITGKAIFEQIMKNLNLATNYENIYTSTYLISFLSINFPELKETELPTQIINLCLPDDYNVLQKELTEFYSALNFLSFNLNLDVILKFYPATTVIFTIVGILVIVYYLKMSQRKRRLKTPWKYKTFAQDLKIFKKQGMFGKTGFSK